MVHWTNSNLYIFFLKKYIRFKSESFAGIMRIASPFPIELDREQPSYVCSRLYGFLKKKCFVRIIQNNLSPQITRRRWSYFFSYRVNNILVYRSVSCFFFVSWFSFVSWKPQSLVNITLFSHGQWERIVNIGRGLRHCLI